MAIQENKFFVSSEIYENADQEAGQFKYVWEKKSCSKVLKVTGAQIGIMGATTALGSGGLAGVGALIGLAGGPVAPVSVPICASIGAGIGFFVSAILGPVIVSELPCAEEIGTEYKEWKLKMVQKGLLSVIKEKFGDEPLFTTIQEGIRHDFYKDPVSPPCGHSVERSHILQHLKANNMCPDCHVPFKEEELRTDYLMLGKTSKVFATIFAREAQNPDLPVQSATDLSQITQKLNDEVQDYFFKQSTSLNTQLSEKVISAVIYRKRMTDLMELLD